MPSLFRDRSFALPLAVMVSGLLFAAALAYHPASAGDPVAASQGYGPPAAAAPPAAGKMLGGVVGGVFVFTFVTILVFFAFLYAVELAVKVAGWVGDRTPLGRMGLAQAVQFVLLMFKSIR